MTLTVEIPVKLTPEQCAKIVEALEEGGPVQLELAPEGVRQHKEMLEQIGQLHEPGVSVEEKIEEIREEPYQASPDDFADELDVEEYE